MQRKSSALPKDAVQPIMIRNMWINHQKTVIYELLLLTRKLWRKTSLTVGINLYTRLKQPSKGVLKKMCSMVAEGCHSEKKQTTNKQRKVVCVLEKFCI